MYAILHSLWLPPEDGVIVERNRILKAGGFIEFERVNGQQLSLPQATFW